MQRKKQRPIGVTLATRLPLSLSPIWNLSRNQSALKMLFEAQDITEKSFTRDILKTPSGQPLTKEKH
jgi:hypothetical protein